jgi:peptidyl-Asp metalloendopeptidase
MQWNLRISGVTLMLALCPLSQAISAQAPELFKPMPLAAFASAQDETLLAIHEVPAFRMINRVAADTSVLGADTKEVALTIAPGVRSDVKRTHADTLPDGSVVWRGRWNDNAIDAMTLDAPREWSDAANDVTLVSRQGRITGSIRANGQLYSVRPLASGGHAIIAVSEADMPAELPPMEADHAALPLASAPQQRTAAAGINARVMIVFSDNAARALADPVGLAHLAVAETNDGYARSGVAHRLEMVGNVYLSEYRDSGALGTDLSRLKETRDGVIDWIHNRRNEQRADLVTLITAGGDACGVGYFNSGAGSAFTVATKDCATGYYSYGHELGHNYGATHNPAAGSNNVYPYGHGFQNVAARLRTVMAYECAAVNCTRVNIWSGPNNRWNGNLMGNGHESDNARVLNQRAATVAGFR